MNPNPKRLIEVDLPIRRISEHARREKSIRHGHISTLHIWWARRPLAACRAVICAALWPDPADPFCPEGFRDTARKQMRLWSKECLGKSSSESYNHFIRIQNDTKYLDDNYALRMALLDFIADFANWDNSTAEEYLNTSRILTQAAHLSLGGMNGNRPLVLDPFAGGGSIPLEALRVGAEAFAGDLNPIPVLLNKVVLEYIPKYGTRLAEEVRRWGNWVKAQADIHLGEFYPLDEDGSTPIAYIWARTIRCEGPGCGAEIPLLRSPWLSKNGRRSVAIKVVPNREKKQVELHVVEGKQIVKGEGGTVRRSAATCPVCGYTTSSEAVRNQTKAERGGATKARLAAVVLSRPGATGKSYRSALPRDTESISQSVDALNVIDDVPNEELPYLRSIFNINLLGVDTWGKLFAPRQQLVISTLVRIIKGLGNVPNFPSGEFGRAIKTCLAFAVDRHIDQQSTLVTWIPSIEAVSHTFVRQALGITWDYCEPNPLSDSGGNLAGAIEWVAKVIDQEAHAGLQEGSAQLVSATESPLPDDSVSALFTDPPYYDAVPYADLSDYFYVWLRRMLRDDYPHLFEEPLSPKNDEIVQLAERNPKYAFKTKERFEQLMTEALSSARRAVKPSGIGVVVFAHKETSAWETMISSVINAGWVVTASWPIDTERAVRLRAMGSAALGSSVHLVCRPRKNENGVGLAEEIGDWRDVLIELPGRIHEWMPRLAEEGVVGADAIFACLGPALEIFSRYSRVEKANGEAVTLGEYLEYIWAAVSKEAISMVFKGADASGFEEDARLTAMWLWTLSTNQNGKSEPLSEEDNVDEEAESVTDSPKGYILEFDAARKISQGLGARLEALTSLVEVRGETARLLPVAERTRKLFGKDDAEATTTSRKRKSLQMQLGFVAELEQSEQTGAWGTKGVPSIGITALDRVHQSMILFAAGRGEALKRFLVDEGVGRDQRFWSLAQVLSYLYPSSSEEKRWIDGVLARKKGLGF